MHSIIMQNRNVITVRDQRKKWSGLTGLTGLVGWLPVLLCLMMATSSLSAAVRTWDGGGGDGLWSNAMNWDGDVTAPSANDELVFAGIIGVSTTNDLPTANISFNSITFDNTAGAFILGGSGITLAGNVTNNSNSSQRISMAMIMAATRTFDCTGGEIRLSGVVSGAGGLIKSGNNNLHMGIDDTALTMTYSGGSTISAGALVGSAQNNASFGTGTITIGNGATLFLQRNQIANDIVNDGGTIFFDNGWGNSISGTITNNANLNLICYYTGHIISGVISGSGGIAVTGFVNGSAVFTAANTYTGTTTILSGTLQIGNGGTTGSLSSFSAITVTSPGVLKFNRSNSVALGTDCASVISGTGSVTQAGSGTLIVGATQTYTGSTTIIAGILQIGDAGTAGALSINSAITVTSPGTLAFNRSDTITGGVEFANVIDGTGAVTQSGSGSVIFASTQTYTGATTISAGTLQIGNGSTDGSIATSASITDNAALIYNLVTSGAYGNVISGTGTLTKTGAGTLTLSGANTLSGGVTLSAGTLNINHATALGTGTFTIAGGTTIDNSTAGAITMTARNPQTWSGNFTFTGTNALNLGGGAVAMGGATQVTVSASTLTVGGVISGAGGLTKAGTGTLTLGGTSTYSGATIVSAGILKLNNAPTAPVAGYARWFDASTSANMTLAGAGNLVNQWNDLSGNVAHATPQTGDGYVHNPTYVANSLNGLGAIHFIGGPNIIDSNNTNLLFARDASIRTTFSVFKGASFLLTDLSDYHFHRFLNPDDSYNPDPATSLWVSRYVSANITGGTTYVNGTAVDGTSSAMPTASNNGFNLVVVSTTGNVSADGFNRDRIYNSGDQYQAEVIIYNTVLSTPEIEQVERYLNSKWGLGITGFSGGYVLPIGTALSIAVGATLDLNGVSQQVASLADSGGGGGSVINNGGADTILTVSGTSSATFSGVISDGSTKKMAVTKADSGTLTLSGASTYTGATTINGGMISVSSLNNVIGGTASSNLGAPASAGNGTIAIGSTATAGTLLYTGTGEITDRVINLTGTTGGGIIDQSGTGLLKFTSALTATGVGVKMLTLQGSTAGTGEINAAIVDSSSATALTKTGSGTWTLSGTNTYTGATTISAGTLLVTGATHSSSAVTVASGAALGGTGTVAGTIAVSAGGTLAPGTGGTTIGNLSTGAVSFASSGVLSVDLDNANPANEKMTTTGTFTCTNGTLTVASVTSPAPGTVYTIVSATAISGTFSGLAEGATFSQQNHTFQISYLGNQVTLTDMPTTRTWDGGSVTTNNWTDAANWVGDGVPNAGDHLVFAGAARFNPCVNNFAPATNFASITFDNTASLFVLSGTSITLAGNITNNDADPQAINLDMAMALTRTVDAASGDITLTGILSGAGGLTKSGATTLTLSGTNTYTGATTVGAGTLLVTGSIATSSGVAVSSGATASGTGTLSGVTNSGGVISPGTTSTKGILTAASLSCAGGTNSTVALRVAGYATAGTSYDQLTMSGALTLGGSSILSIDATGLSGAGTAVGVIQSGSIVGTFASVQITNNTTGMTMSVVYNATSIDIVVANSPPVLASIELGTLAYIENASATAITVTTTVADIDNLNLASATVQITGNYQNGQDVLSYVQVGSIVGTWTVGTGTMSLVGSDTLANYRLALRAVTYQNTSDNPSTLVRTASFIANDGTTASNTVARTITITATNDAPVLAASEAGTLAYTENAAATAITATTTVADVDNLTLTSAVVQITGNYQSAEDVLSYVQVGSIVGTWTASSGTMDLVGVDTLANYQLALRAVSYQNTSNNPSTSVRTVSFTSNDGTTASLAVTRTITITATNDAPVLAASEAGTLAYTENAAATAITATTTVADVDNVNLASAVVQITGNYQSAEDVLSYVQVGSIVGTWTVGTGTMSLVGSDTLANYQLALRAVSYQNTSNNPSTTVRTVSFIANDGTDPSLAVTRTITITATNDAPVLAAIEAGTLAYIENASVTAITATTTVADIDNLNLASATVQITGNYQNGQDVLSYVQVGSIVGTWTVGSGTMSLVGSDTLANYRLALRAVSYQNTSNNPSTTVRTVSFIANDGTTASNTVTRTITITATNDAPVLAAIEGTTLAYIEDAAATAITASTTVADVDHLNLASATVQITGNYQSAEDVLSYVQVGSIVGTWTASSGTMDLVGVDTLANYQLALRAVSYQNTSDNPNTSVRTVSFIANDGTDPSLAVTRTITITATNNAPVLAAIEGTTLAYIENAAATAITATTTVADVDNVNLASATVQITGNYQSAEDVLSYVQVGNIVGTWTVGSGTMDLVGVDTLANYQLALRAVSYQNTSDNPNTSVRTVSFIANDGTDPSLAVTRTITITATNDAPIITLPGGGVSWIEGLVATDVAPAGTITDSDSSNFLNGNLTMNITNALGGEVLSLRNDGTGAGQIGISGATVSYGGAAIGTLSGGNVSTPLVLSFTSTNATPAAAQAALRALQFVRSGQVLSPTTRTIQVVANDGQDASVAVTTTVSLVPVDDPPQASASMLITVAELPVDGILIGSDPENGALTWEIVTPPASGTLTLLNAATGAVRYLPAAGVAGDLTFTARVSDGTTWSSPATITVRITDRLAGVRPLIVSAPPREGVFGAPLTYQVTTQLGALPSGTDLAFQLIGIPSGSTATVTKTSAISATITWTATGTSEQHQQIGLLVSDPVTGICSYQAIQVLWQITAPAGPG